MKFTVSFDLIVPVLYEVEANNEDEAEFKVLEMNRTELLKYGNTEHDAIGINIDGIGCDHTDKPWSK